MALRYCGWINNRGLIGCVDGLVSLNLAQWNGEKLVAVGQSGYNGLHPVGSHEVEPAVTLEGKLEPSLIFDRQKKGSGVGTDDWRYIGPISKYVYMIADLSSIPPPLRAIASAIIRCISASRKTGTLSLPLAMSLYLLP